MSFPRPVQARVKAPVRVLLLRGQSPLSGAGALENFRQMNPVIGDVGFLTDDSDRQIAGALLLDQLAVPANDAPHAIADHHQPCACHNGSAYSG